MKDLLSIVVLFLGLLTFVDGHTTPQLSFPQHDPIAATRGLIHRRMGPSYNDQITLRVLPSEPNGLDVFEIATHPTTHQIEIAASSATSMSYGLQWYLKTIVHTQTDWNDHRLELPTILPRPLSSIRQQRQSKYTYYQNVCTVSYSSWTWNWSQWESHIDWMALNGINMPLAFTGQEKVWQNVFQKEYNISQQGLNNFFAGSAFLAWGRMGNIRGSWVKGPLPQLFIEDQYLLQLKILQRYKEYGMIPGLPAFAGHVPEELQVKYPLAKYSRSPNWGNFTDDYCCVYLLDAQDPLYKEIGQKFIKEQILLYNYTSSLYQCDTYNEMDPDTTDINQLAASSQAVVSSMTAADPNAVWLMQGWLFMSDYWTLERTRAYLTAVPNDRMMILDLYSEVAPIWKKMNFYFGKQWIYCILHNFGGNTGMRGDLPTIGTDPIVSREQSNGTMVGIGLTMEGIFQNYVVYDLALQMAWEPSPVSLSGWISSYVWQRYHCPQQDAKKAWQLLLTSVYNRTRASGGVTKNIATIFPHWKILSDGFMPTAITYDPNDVIRAWKYLLQASTDPVLAMKDTFRHDLTDVTRQFLSDHLLHQFLVLKSMYETKKEKASTLCALTKQMLLTIEHLDEILATNADFLLGRWLENAQSLGKTNETLREYFEYEARNQITRWGDHNNNVLHDYACKEWAGLVHSYYLKRWRLWLTEVCLSYQENRPMKDQEIFEKREEMELQWQMDRTPFLTTPYGDTISISKRLYSEYINQEMLVFHPMVEMEIA